MGIVLCRYTRAYFLNVIYKQQLESEQRPALIAKLDRRLALTPDNKKAAWTNQTVFFLLSAPEPPLCRPLCAGQDH